MKIVGMIPARYESSRFPGKPLIKINGKTLIRRVWEKARKAINEEDIYVLTDDQRIEEHCSKEGIRTVMTSTSCLTGTDRVYEASKEVNADIYINIQGDEPLIEPSDIKKVVEVSLMYPDTIINAMCPILTSEDFINPSIPKVVTTQTGKLLFISRSPIPISKNKNFKKAMKQVCIYSFPSEKLHMFGRMKNKTPLEEIEDIEILRFLEKDIEVKMIEVSGSSIAVDHPEDVEKVLKALNDQA